VRVAHLVRAVFPQHGYGGMERAATALTTHMLQAGAAVTLVTRPLPGGMHRATPQNPKSSIQNPLAGGWGLGVRRGVGGQGLGIGTGDPASPNPKSKIQNPKLTVIGVPYSLLPLRPNSIVARLTNYPLFVERMGRQVSSLVRRGAVDIVYAHGLCAYGVRQPARRRTPGGRAVPLVMNPHGLEDFKVRHPLKRLAYAPFRAMYARGAQAADRVIATDESLRGEVARYLRVPAGRVVVVPNGVDPAAGPALVAAAEQAALRARYGLTPDLFVGLSVARLEANKGLAYLLRALAAIPAPAPPAAWRWLVVGAGQDRAALETLAGELGLTGRVVFTGAVGEVTLHNLYGLADAFALASLYEGSSLATLEAMAHGLPVVATTVGGLPDKVVPGQTGFLVPPADVPALATALAQLLADRDAAARMGEAGAALVQARFTWAAITAQTLALFEELLRLSST